MTQAQNPVVAIVASNEAAAPVAAAKPRTTRKAQPKAEKKASIVAKSAAVIGLNFIITQAARPVAGRTLYAYTAAVLHVSGMMEGKAVDRAVLTDAMGTTAVAYHLKSTDAFALTPAGIILNGEYGKARLFNTKRQYDPKDFDAFVAMLSDGKMDGRIIKNQGMIRAVKAA